MPDPALLAIALSAGVHVVWNLLARRHQPSSDFLWWALVGYLALVGPWTVPQLVARADWSWRLVACIGVSGAALSLYFLALAKAYERAPAAVVYPLARSSPLPIACVSSWAGAEAMTASAWAGILTGLCGLGLIAWSARERRIAGCLPFAATAALATTVYSLSDRAAVASLGGLGPICGYVAVTFALALAALSSERWWRGQPLPPRRPAIAAWMTASLGVGGAYALIIVAMLGVSAAVAVGLSNAAIVAVGILSMTWLRERDHLPLRCAGLAVLCVGLVLLAVG